MKAYAEGTACVALWSAGSPPGHRERTSLQQRLGVRVLPPHSFKLKPEAADRLADLAAQELSSKPQYIKLLHDLNAQVQPRPVKTTKAD